MKNDDVVSVLGGILLFGLGFYLIRQFYISMRRKEEFSKMFTPGNYTELPTSVETSQGALNNVGNIRNSGTHYQGEISSPSSAFKSFSSLTFGYRAMIQLLRAYYKQHNITTLTGILNRYAPEADNNDTKSYIKNVAEMTSISPTEDLEHILYSDKVQLLIAAMSLIEQGSDFIINPVAIKAAYEMLD